MHTDNHHELWLDAKAGRPITLAYGYCYGATLYQCVFIFCTDPKCECRAHAGALSVGHHGHGPFWTQFAPDLGPDVWTPLAPCQVPNLTDLMPLGWRRSAGALVDHNGAVIVSLGEGHHVSV